MPSINKIFTASPEFKVTREQIPNVADIWLKDDAVSKEKFKRISSNSGVDQRYYIQPYENTLELKGLEQRASIFEEMGVPLLSSAVSKCLEASSYDRTEVDFITFTSCSVPIIPSIDAPVILNCKLPNTIGRIPIFQHGCVGGVVSLSLGSKLAKLGKPVLVTSLELCSLVFQFGNTAGSQLVGASIFADGAAALLIEPNEGKLNFIDSMSYLIPNSRHLMGYDIHDDGFHLRLDRDLPSLLTKEAPALVRSFLAKNNLNLKDIDYWLFHPGGVRILDLLVQSLDLSQEQCHWSYDTLREHGNMSSSTILYVLEKFQNQISLSRTQYALIMGIGPGLTVEMILLRGTC